MTGKLFAGFDLGGTQLKLGLIDQDGNLLFHDRTDTPPTIDGLMELLRSRWLDLKGKGRGQISACGFGFPGIFSLKERRIFKSPNYPELDNFDLFAAMKRFIDVPFWVDNDANLAAYGEWAHGAGRRTQSLVLLTIGTGIGSGIILEGQLWHGKCGFAGELGHVVVNHEGEICKCGVRGCLETESAAPKIVKNYLEIKKTRETTSAEEIFRRAGEGDQAARQSFSRAGYYLGIGLGIVINFLNPEMILLGGGVMSAGDYLLAPALAEAKRRCYAASFACCTIERAVLGNEAGIIGAASWARQQLSPQNHG